MKLKRHIQIRKGSNMFNLLIFSLFLFVIRFLMLSNTSGPIICDDEVDYLRNARILLNKEMVMPKELAVEVPWGYSIILVPIIALFNNPESQYKMILLLNSIFYIVGLLVIYKSLCYLNKDRRISFLLTVMVGLYPPLFMYGFFSTTEAFYQFLNIVYFYIGMMLYGAKENNSVFYILLIYSVISIFIFFTRGNGFVNVVFGFIFVIFSNLKLNFKKIGLYFVLIFVMLFVGLLIVEKINEGIAYKEVVLNYGFKYIFEWKFWLYLIKVFFGQIFYLNIASFGLLISTFVFFIVCKIGNNCVVVVKNNFERSIFRFSKLYFALFLSNIAVSVTFLSLNSYKSDTEGSYYFYGRYNDVLMAPLLVIMLSFLSRLIIKKNKDSKEYLSHFTLSVLISLFVTVVAVFIFRWLNMFTSRVNIFNSISFDPWLSIWNFRLGIFFGCLMLFIGMFVLVYSLRKDKKFGVVLFVTYCVLINVFIIGHFYYGYYMNGVNAYSNRRQIVELFERYEMDIPSVICVDKSGYVEGAFYRYYFRTPNTKYYLVDTEKVGELEKCSNIISSNLYLNDTLSNFFLISIENVYKQSLWIDQNKISEDYGKYLINLDVYLKNNPDKQKNLVYFYKIYKSDFVRPIFGSYVYLKIKLFNNSNFPWINMDSIKNWNDLIHTAPINLDIIVMNNNNTIYNSRCNLSRIVYPGEFLDIECKLSKSLFRRGGKYEISLDLVHEDIRFFSSEVSNRYLIPIIY